MSRASTICRIRLTAILLPLIACGGAARSGNPSTPPAPPAATPGVLARFSTEPVMVVPVTAAGEDSAAWRMMAGGEARLRTMADSLLETTFRGRGLSTWIYGAAVSRTARRNPTYLADPSTLRPALAIRAALRQPERTISEPLSSQLRALAGASGGARYTLVPVDLEVRPAGTILTIAMIDVRLSQLLWTGRVTGDASTSWNTSILTDLMERAADLVVPR